MLGHESRHTIDFKNSFNLKTNTNPDVVQQCNPVALCCTPSPDGKRISSYSLHGIARADDGQPEMAT